MILTKVATTTIVFYGGGLFERHRRAVFMAYVLGSIVLLIISMKCEMGNVCTVMLRHVQGASNLTLCTKANACDLPAI